MNGTQHKIVGVGFGLAGAYAVVAGKGDTNGALIAATSIIGCMLPDMDHDRTKLGRKRKLLTGLATNVANAVVFGGIVIGLVGGFLVFKGFVDFGVNPIMLFAAAIGFGIVAAIKKIIGDSAIFKWATKHRGLMHTLVVPALLWFAMMASEYPIYHYAIEGLFVGYISHLFADMLTVEGCPILFPLTRSNWRFPTKFQTKDPICTKAAYVVAALSVGASYLYVNFFVDYLGNFLGNFMEKFSGLFGG